MKEHINFKGMEPREIVGTKIGTLKVVSYEFPPGKEFARSFKCICDCGKLVWKNKGYFDYTQTPGHHKSCGCRKGIIEENISSKEIQSIKRYNSLVIEEVVRKDTKGNKYYSCRCDCGRKTIVVGYALKNGNTKTCGCGIGKKHSLESN